jgi:hypothetical protein
VTCVHTLLRETTRCYGLCSPYRQISEGLSKRCGATHAAAASPTNSKPCFSIRTPELVASLLRQRTPHALLDTLAFADPLAAPAAKNLAQRCVCCDLCSLCWAGAAARGPAACELLRQPRVVQGGLWPGLSLGGAPANVQCIARALLGRARLINALGLARRQLRAQTFGGRVQGRFVPRRVLICILSSCLSTMCCLAGAAVGA